MTGRVCEEALTLRGMKGKKIERTLFGAIKGTGSEVRKGRGEHWEENAERGGV